MGIDRFVPADLTRLLFQLAGLHGALHRKVSILFARIGSTPIRLAGIGFQHLRILPHYRPPATLRGLPPLRPFSRAAATFARDRA